MPTQKRPRCDQMRATRRARQMASGSRKQRAIRVASSLLRLAVTATPRTITQADRFQPRRDSRSGRCRRRRARDYRRTSSHRPCARIRCHGVTPASAPPASCAAPHGRIGARPSRHLAYEAGSGAGTGARRRRRTRVSQNAGSTTGMRGLRCAFEGGRARWCAAPHGRTGARSSRDPRLLSRVGALRPARGGGAEQGWRGRAGTTWLRAGGCVSGGRGGVRVFG